MANIAAAVIHIARQATAPGSSPEAVPTVEYSSSAGPVGCPTGNNYNGDIGIRISAIFVILIGSMMGI